MTTVLAHTPLHDWHASHGGRMVDFAGWDMPVMYRSITDEHLATRNAVGLFDISHMGRLRFDGKNAAAFLDSILTRRVVDLAVGEVRYALVTNDAGGILDDVLVYRLRDGANTDYHMLVVNASNREKILGWIQSRISATGVTLTDLTDMWGMIAVQGPRALEIVAPLVGLDPYALSYYSSTESTIMGHGGIISRTGYTGEDGCELIVGRNALPELWLELESRCREAGGMPAGLGARDTLRLEAGMPLYGHEITEEVDPVTAGLKFAVNVEGRDFPGRDALVDVLQRAPTWRRVGFTLDGKRVPRQGCAVLQGDTVVGKVTSGTFSPTLNFPICMAYVKNSPTASDNPYSIDIRGKREPAHLVKLPFYRRADSTRG